MEYTGATPEGTWHSGNNLAEWCPEAITVLKKVNVALTEYLKVGTKGTAAYRYIVQPWLMVTPPTGAYAVPHTHPNCQVGGVFYISTGKPI